MSASRLFVPVPVLVPVPERNKTRLCFETGGRCRHRRFRKTLCLHLGARDRTSGSGPRLLNLVSSEEPEELYAYGPTPPDPDGRFQFMGLPPGKYLVVARSGSSGEVRVPIQVGEREQREVDVGLE